MDYKKAYEDSLGRAKELWGIYKGERHIIEFIFPEVCYLKDKEERLKDMTSEKRKELTCPKCGVALNDKNYDEHTVYHNCIMGLCKKCGYEAPIHVFFKNQ